MRRVAGVILYGLTTAWYDCVGKRERDGVSTRLHMNDLTTNVRTQKKARLGKWRNEVCIILL